MSDYEIGESDFLVLLSDKASQFLYANPAYLEACGYSWEELCGTPTARMVHKDTPFQVSHDMVRTLRAQQPWTGVIKNQRKDGRAYWVRLNMSPLFSQGAFAGALLVHSKPTSEEIVRHEAMYRRMREDNTLLLSHGRAIGNTRLSRTLDKIRNRGLNARIWGSMVSLNVAALTGLLLVAGSTAPAWIAAAVFLACTLFLGVHLSRTIVTPLRAAVSMANRIAAGDLGASHSQRNSNGEIGSLVRALTQMSMNLRATVLDVRSGTRVIQEAITGIVGGTHELANRTAEQGERLEHTAVSIGRIDESVRETATRAREASQLAESARVAADSGGEVVGQVITTMQGIAVSSRKIAEIINVIDGIAFQTNLLALNAAIEAARAADHGRGFAVVAGEVRGLAQRTAHSAREIKGLISTSAEQVVQGSALVNAAGQAIDNIVVQVRRVTALIEQIAGTASGQAASMDEVTQDIESLDRMTGENALLVQRRSSAAESLRAQAANLVAAVQVFKLSELENLALYRATNVAADQGTEVALRTRAA
jgi:aerotaxis receptor